MIQRISLPVILLFASVLVGFSCRRSNIVLPPASSAATGVLVAQPGCSYVVKIINAPIPDSSVVKSWTDTQNDSTFTNVFTVKDGPAMQLAQVAVGDTFTFTLNGPVPDSLSKYASCDVLTSNVPGVYDNVTNIQLQP
jgi:hypothetical protein